MSFTLKICVKRVIYAENKRKMGHLRTNLHFFGQNGDKSKKFGQKFIFKADQL
jgi:hypothetical protein